MQKLMLSSDIVKENFHKILHGGAEYCDCRLFSQDIRDSVVIENGNCKENETGMYAGIGIRVLFKGAWGFASTSTISLLQQCFEQALINAKVAAQLVSEPLNLTASKSPHNSRFQSPVVIPPVQVNLKDKLDFLYEIDKQLNEHWVLRRILSVKNHTRDIFFWNTEDTYIERSLTDVFGYFKIMALDKDGCMQHRSHSLFTDGTGTRGWEILNSNDLFCGHTQRVKDELKQLVTAEELSRSNRSLILLPGQGFLQLHETIGHALELDRILGYELSYAGGSFVTLNDFGSLQYGSQKLTVSVYDSIVNSPGTFGYDDEGVAQHTYLLIDRGLLVNALTSRASIGIANQRASKEIFQTSGATARANNFYRSPIERMSNLSIRPGTDGTLEDIISNTENGVIMDNATSWSIGSNREHFHFGCEIAWEVKNGKKTRVLKNPTYQGHTLPFFRNLSAVGDSSTWRVVQVENCGKGEPNQEIELGHGVPILKFEHVVTGEQE